MLYLGALFLAKVLDNALSTTKTILIQRSRWVLAGIAVILSDFLYFWITKRIVSADSMLALAVVAAAGGVGCSLACLVSDKLSKDRIYVNVIMSDDRMGKPHYGALRSTFSRFKSEATGSDKHYSFSIAENPQADTVHLFEAAIDLLSYATLEKYAGRDWKQEALLSLAGVFAPKRQGVVPVALSRFLEE